MPMHHATMEPEEELFQQLEQYCSKAPSLQQETLKSILTHNARVEYLQKYGLNGRTDAKSFKQCIPLASFSDYAGEIQRIADGDKSPILSADPLLCMFFSSGTSSQQPKLIPHFDSEQSRRGARFIRQIAAETLKKAFPPRPGSKSLCFMYAGNIMETKGGVKAMAATAYGLRSPREQTLISMFVSPAQVFFGSDVSQQMYCHLLCCLRTADALDNIRAPYAHGLLKAFRLLESQWPQLCNDIRRGYISPNLITDSAMREAVEEGVLAGPNSDIAERIEKECKKGEWGGIVRRLWPNARYLSCVTTGSMEQYYPPLKYYAGDVPLLGGDFLASECSIGVNVDRTRDPQHTLFTMVPTVAYYEFLCVDDRGVPDTATPSVDLCNVEVGKMYEVVVTTFRGLYRYRVGDIVRIRGFYGSTPQVEYVSKVSSSTDIVNEKQLRDAVCRVGKILSDETQMEILEFACYTDWSSCRKRIEMFWEMRNCPKLEQFQDYEGLLRKYCALVDNCLDEFEYVRMERLSGNLGPSELCFVQEGTFDVIMDLAIRKGAIASQYKAPRIIRNPDVLAVFRASTLIKAS